MLLQKGKESNQNTHKKRKGSEREGETMRKEKNLNLLYQANKRTESKLTTKTNLL